jgi:hypothetical protein
MTYVHRIKSKGDILLLFLLMFLQYNRLLFIEGFK